ncbi:MAG TPA: sodium/proline symporter PutP [Allosphingosinicella sp.]|nr:sodium/proline symporter PutP [Allosphingosinicella sp.]
MKTGILISLGIYFLAMLAIGFYAWRTSTSTLKGFLLGGRNLGPGVAALSAGAADMSGWLLMGLPGAMFVSGLGAGWIAVGLLIGAYLNYRLVAPRLRVQTERADDSITVPRFFEKRFDDHSGALRTISALVIIIFFTLYTSSGMVAGGKLFQSAFGADYALGLWVTAGVVVIYTFFGGFMAVSLTDFVQGVIMFVALILVPVVALLEVGGGGAAAVEVARANPAMLDPLAGLGFAAIASSLAWGLGYFGQPHILVRFMAIRSLRDVPRMRWIGISWMTIALVGALATGFAGFALATQRGIAVEDPETIFILLSNLLFHPLITGFLLAALLAAIMSTISSQLLVSSSSLTEDLYRSRMKREATDKELVRIGRFCVLAVSLVAIALAWNPDNNILGLVANAWAGFGAAFGPIVLLGLCWRRLTRDGALAGMIAGTVTVLFWIYAPVLDGGATLSSLLYEMIPGFLACAAAAVGVSLAGAPPPAHVLARFDESEVELREARQ